MYSSTHSETVDELLEWPWRRFERFYEAYMKRSLVESLEARKNSMIAALWSNSNYDDDKGTRAKAIEELEENFAEISTRITLGIVEEQEEEQIDEDNPFFSAAKRGMAKLEQPRNDEGNVADVVGDDYRKFVDQ